MHAQRATVTNPAVLAELLRPVCGNVAVGPGAGGRIDVSIDSIVVGGAATHQIRTVTGAAFRSEDKIDGYVFVMLHEGEIRAGTGRSERIWRAPSCAILNPEDIGNGQWHAGSYELLTIGGHDVRRRLSSLLGAPVAYPVVFGADASPTSEGAMMALSVMRFMRSLPGAGVLPSMAMATAGSVRDVAVAVFLEMFRHNYTERVQCKAPGPLPRHIRSAIEFIHDHAQESICVEEIASAAHASVRTLQTGFASFRGVTPMAYLKQVRLEGARDELIRAGNATIAEVAARWRFTHLGLFAKAYRDAFGELPSETRRFSRAKAGMDGVLPPCDSDAGRGHEVRACAGPATHPGNP